MNDVAGIVLDIEMDRVSDEKVNEDFNVVLEDSTKNSDHVSVEVEVEDTIQGIENFVKNLILFEDLGRNFELFSKNEDTRTSI